MNMCGLAVFAQRESTGRVPGEVHQWEGPRNRLVVSCGLGKDLLHRPPFG
jgi:hypothetical protein